MFIFVVTYIHPIKKSLTRVWCLTDVLLGVCQSMTFSNDIDMVELQKVSLHEKNFRSKMGQMRRTWVHLCTFSLLCNNG